MGFYGSKFPPPINNAVTLINSNPGAQQMDLGITFDATLTPATFDEEAVASSGGLSDIDPQFVTSNVISQNANKAGILDLLKNTPTGYRDISNAVKYRRWNKWVLM